MADEKQMNKELFIEASKCESPEQLIELCKKHNIEISAEEAEKFLEQVKEKQLSLDSIESVDGGQLCIGAISIPCIVAGV